MTWNPGDHVRHKGTENYINWVMKDHAILAAGERGFIEVPLAALELISPITESTTVPEAAEASKSGEVPEEPHVNKSEAQSSRSPSSDKEEKKTRGRR